MVSLHFHSSLSLQLLFHLSLVNFKAEVKSLFLYKLETQSTCFGQSVVLNVLVTSHRCVHPSSLVVGGQLELLLST